MTVMWVYHCHHHPNYQSQSHHNRHLQPHRLIHVVESCFSSVIKQTNINIWFSLGNTNREIFHNTLFFSLANGNGATVTQRHYALRDKIFAFANTQKDIFCKCQYTSSNSLFLLILATQILLGGAGVRGVVGRNCHTKRYFSEAFAIILYVRLVINYFFIPT